MSFEAFLKITGGTTVKLFDKLANDKKHAVFFQPFQSKTDLAFRGTSIVTAPVVSAGMAVFLPCASIFFACKSFIHLFTDTKVAKADISDAGAFLVVTGVAIVSAVTSALINLIDFLGSIITTLHKKCSKPPIVEMFDTEDSRTVRTYTGADTFESRDWSATKRGERSVTAGEDMTTDLPFEDARESALFVPR